MPSVSHSEVESYLTCRRKWWYGYGLSLQRQDESMGLALGSAGHEILAAFYRTILEGGDTLRAQKKMVPAATQIARLKYEELVEQGWEDSDDRRMPLEKLMFEHYFPNEPFVEKGWLILAVEQEFNLEYDSESELRMPFVIDVIAKSPEKRIVIVDHKFLGQFYSSADVELMPQIPKYIAGLRALGHRVDEGLYNLVKTTNIKGDKLRKDELISALGGVEGKLHVGPDDVVDLKKYTVDVLVSMAEKQGVQVYAGPTVDQMLEWVPIKPNNVRVQQTFIEQIDTADEIQRRKEMDQEDLDRVSFRTANKMVCNGCSFRDLCSTELSGGNTKLMIQSEYKVRERRAFAEVSEELEV